MDVATIPKISPFDEFGFIVGPLQDSIGKR